ncbi:MAG TPA: NADH-quinone oxidoreductase subunit J [Pirellulales bacterium]|jgi:NADH:ubiquinone oxidoreductase subunit 6 (subunit J)
MNPINWHTVFFYLYALVACGFGVAVVISTNIVRMALYLIFSLGATAGLFFLAGADFVGSMQLLIYVGGTLVLLIFGVMLTAQGPLISLRTSGGDWIVAMLLAGCLAALLVPAGLTVSSWNTGRPAPTTEQVAGNGAQPVLVSTTEKTPQIPLAGGLPDVDNNGIPDKQPITAAPIGLGLLGARVDKLENVPEALRPGMSGYLLPFEVISVHLLVVLVGAAYLARSKRSAMNR